MSACSDEIASREVVDLLPLNEIKTEPVEDSVDKLILETSTGNTVAASDDNSSRKSVLTQLLRTEGNSGNEAINDCIVDYIKNETVSENEEENSSVRSNSEQLDSLPCDNNTDKNSFESNQNNEERSGETQNHEERSGETQDHEERSGETQDREERSGETQDHEERSGETQDRDNVQYETVIDSESPNDIQTVKSIDMTNLSASNINNVGSFKNVVSGQNCLVLRRKDILDQSLMGIKITKRNKCSKRTLVISSETVISHDSNKRNKNVVVNREEELSSYAIRPSTSISEDVIAPSRDVMLREEILTVLEDLGEATPLEISCHILLSHASSSGQQKFNLLLNEVKTILDKHPKLFYSTSDKWADMKDLTRYCLGWMRKKIVDGRQKLMREHDYCLNMSGSNPEKLMRCEPYKCDKCSYSTFYRNHLQQHINTQRCNIPWQDCLGILGCTPKRTPGAGKRTSAKVSNSDTETTVESELEKNPKLLKRLYCCIECDFETEEKEALKSHIISSHCSSQSMNRTLSKPHVVPVPVERSDTPVRKRRRRRRRPKCWSVTTANIKKSIDQDDKPDVDDDNRGGDESNREETTDNDKKADVKECDIRDSVLTINVNLDQVKNKRRKSESFDSDNKSTESLPSVKKTGSTIDSNRRFECMLCDFVSLNAVSLACHTKKNHSLSNQIKLHSCSSCGYSAFIKPDCSDTDGANKGQILKYFCSDCKFRTSTRSRLNFHTKTFHSKDGFKCIRCGFTDFPKTRKKSTPVLSRWSFDSDICKNDAKDRNINEENKNKISKLSSESVDTEKSTDSVDELTESSVKADKRRRRRRTENELLLAGIVKSKRFMNIFKKNSSVKNISDDSALIVQTNCSTDNDQLTINCDKSVDIDTDNKKPVINEANNQVVVSDKNEETSEQPDVEPQGKVRTETLSKKREDRDTESPQKNNGTSDDETNITIKPGSQSIPDKTQHVNDSEINNGNIDKKSFDVNNQPVDRVDKNLQSIDKNKKDKVINTSTDENESIEVAKVNPCTDDKNKELFRKTNNEVLEEISVRNSDSRKGTVAERNKTYDDLNETKDRKVASKTDIKCKKTCKDSDSDDEIVELLKKYKTDYRIKRSNGKKDYEKIDKAKVDISIETFTNKDIETSAKGVEQFKSQSSQDDCDAASDGSQSGVSFNDDSSMCPSESDEEVEKLISMYKTDYQIKKTRGKNNGKRLKTENAQILDKVSDEASVKRGRGRRRTTVKDITCQQSDKTISDSTNEESVLTDLSLKKQSKSNLKEEIDDANVTNRNVIKEFDRSDSPNDQKRPEIDHAGSKASKIDQINNKSLKIDQQNVDFKDLKSTDTFDKETDKKSSSKVTGRMSKSQINNQREISRSLDKTPEIPKFQISKVQTRSKSKCNETKDDKIRAKKIPFKSNSEEIAKENVFDKSQKTDTLTETENVLQSENNFCCSKDSFKNDIDLGSDQVCKKLPKAVYMGKVNSSFDSDEDFYHLMKMFKTDSKMQSIVPENFDDSQSLCSDRLNASGASEDMISESYDALNFNFERSPEKIGDVESLDKNQNDRSKKVTDGNCEISNGIDVGVKNVDDKIKSVMKSKSGSLRKFSFPPVSNEMQIKKPGSNDDGSSKIGIKGKVDDEVTTIKEKDDPDSTERSSNGIDKSSMIDNSEFSRNVNELQESNDKTTPTNTSIKRKISHVLVRKSKRRRKTLKKGSNNSQEQPLEEKKEKPEYEIFIPDFVKAVSKKSCKSVAGKMKSSVENGKDTNCESQLDITRDGNISQSSGSCEIKKASLSSDIDVENNCDNNASENKGCGVSPRKTHSKRRRKKNLVSYRKAKKKINLQKGCFLNVSESIAVIETDDANVKLSEGLSISTVNSSEEVRIKRDKTADSNDNTNSDCDGDIVKERDIKTYPKASGIKLRIKKLQKNKFDVENQDNVVYSLSENIEDTVESKVTCEKIKKVTHSHRTSKLKKVCSPTRRVYGGVKCSPVSEKVARNRKDVDKSNPKHTDDNSMSLDSLFNSLITDLQCSASNNRDTMKSDLRCSGPVIYVCRKLKSRSKVTSDTERKVDRIDETGPKNISGDVLETDNSISSRDDGPPKLSMECNRDRNIDKSLNDDAGVDHLNGNFKQKKSRVHKSNRESDSSCLCSSVDMCSGTEEEPPKLVDETIEVARSIEECGSKVDRTLTSNEGDLNWRAYNEASSLDKREEIQPPLLSLESESANQLPDSSFESNNRTKTSKSTIGISGSRDTENSALSSNRSYLKTYHTLKYNRKSKGTSSRLSETCKSDGIANDEMLPPKLCKETDILDGTEAPKNSSDSTFKKLSKPNDTDRTHTSEVKAKEEDRGPPKLRVESNLCLTGNVTSDNDSYESLTDSSNEEPTFQCTHCDSKLKSSKALVDHLSVKHSNSISDPKTNRKSSDKSDEFGLNCARCGEKYKSTPELVKHIRSVHINSPDKQESTPNKTRVSRRSTKY